MLSRERPDEGVRKAEAFTLRSGNVQPGVEKGPGLAGREECRQGRKHAAQPAALVDGSPSQDLEANRRSESDFVGFQEGIEAQGFA